MSGRAPCVRVPGLRGLRDLALAPDGTRLIAVAGFEQSPDLLTFDVSDPGRPLLLSCTGGGFTRRCGLSEALTDDYSVALAISPDGRNVYGALPDGADSGAVFAFGPATGIATRTLVFRAGAVRIRLTCPAEASGGTCAGRLSVDRAPFPDEQGKPLGRMPYRVRAGTVRTFRLGLSRPRVRRVMGKRTVRRVEVVATDGSGLTVDSRQAVDLRRAR
jgi:hypothetical protein